MFRLFIALLSSLLLLACERHQESHLAASVAMECEAYRIETGRKTDWTKFTVTFVPEKDRISYKKLSGPDWMIPDGTELKLLWRSSDGLRFVAEWIDSRYGKNEKIWSPVIIFDFDFARLRYSAKRVGGFADFDVPVSDPWKQECRRLN